MVMFFRKYFFIVMKIFFCLIGLVNETAMAAAFDSEYTKPLPQAVDLTENEFLNTTEKITEKPFVRSDFQYSVRLPLSWKKSGASLIDNAPSNDFSYGPVVEFIGPPRFGASSIFEVQVYDLKHAMSSFHWLYHHMFANGYSVEAIEPQSWYVTQATYITFERGNSYKVRLKAILFGPSVVVASYYLPTGSYEKEKGDRKSVV